MLPKLIQSGQLCTVGDKNILFGVNNLLSSLFYIKDKKQRACILSLDFFKAYDRVFLPYLVKVMEKMNLGRKFISWVQMLHKDAKTLFILSKLTDPIKVSFSIRQGDPLAMILYIIYIEPLLLYLERHLNGLEVARGPNVVGIRQVLEAYCDDVNIFTSSYDDLVKASDVIAKFEAISGAILSRNLKCKILGFGSWKGK